MCYRGAVGGGDADTADADADADAGGVSKAKNLQKTLKYDTITLYPHSIAVLSHTGEGRDGKSLAE